MKYNLNVKIASELSRASEMRTGDISVAFCEGEDNAFKARDGSLVVCVGNESDMMSDIVFLDLGQSSSFKVPHNYTSEQIGFRRLPIGSTITIEIV